MKRTSSLKTYLNFIIASIVFVIASSAQAQYSTAMPEIKEFTVASKILNQQRKITIYKPPVLAKYNQAISPVLYVFDAEVTNYYYCTLVNYWCERFPQMPAITVVGIENEPRSITSTGGTNFTGRYKDLTPLLGKDSARFGGAEKFLQFIREELFPFVEKDYKTQPYRVVAGSSLSALLVMHTFCQHPEMFNGYIASSPAMQLDNSAFMKIAEEAINKAKERNGRLFFSVGNEPDPFLPNARKIDSLLKNKNFKGLSHQFVYYPKEGHATLKTFQDGMQYIFMTDRPDADMKASDITYSVFEKHYESLSTIFGYTIKPPEAFINSFAYRLLNESKNIDKALEFFKKNIENYPNSANAHDSYAEALLKKGDKKNAITYYEKAYQMDSTNTAARDIANKLKSE